MKINHQISNEVCQRHPFFSQGPGNSSSHIFVAAPDTVDPHTCGLKKSSRTKSFDRRGKDREVRRFDLARKVNGLIIPSSLVRLIEAIKLIIQCVAAQSLVLYKSIEEWKVKF
jgi:hypothetical protein